VNSGSESRASERGNEKFENPKFVMYLISYPTISWSCKLEKSKTPLRF
jgi:hypothetical protein